MPWVRYDDRYRRHPKIEPLSDRLFRLATEAIMWCAENTTDGRIRPDQLTLIRRSAKPADAAQLVDRDIWHRAGHRCQHAACPPSTGDGWIIHDYWDYQPSRAQVAKERDAKVERQRRWRQSKRRDGDASTQASRDGPVDASRDGDVDAAPGDASPYPPPPRPAPKQGAGGARPAPAARRDAAGRPGGGEPEDQNHRATARPHPNGQPVHPPPELLADVRKRLAEASSRARRSPSAGGAFQALRQATPDVPATTEPTQEPA